MADADGGDDAGDERWKLSTAVATPATAVERPPGPVLCAATRGAAAHSPFDPPPGPRFAETAELGRGGMGRVFEALDIALDRPVAIKQSLTGDAELAERFEREVRITARLQHPGIVPVLDAGRDRDGRPYYVMRKIEGRPLAVLIEQAATAADRLALVPRIAAAVDAVAYAHARGVIHRDIKPWNVLIGPFGETLVIDWGLARELGAAGDAPSSPAATADPADGLTRVGSAMGTPGFMAPEQARGEPLDRRADVYALGATLYHAVTGKRPFDGVAPTVAIERAAAGDLPDLARIPDAVPAALTAIVAKALAPAPADRYASAADLATDLRRFLAGQLVAAHRYTRRELIARWLGRHRIAVAVGAVAVVALAAIATLAIRGVIDARDTARAAQRREAARADDMLVERADGLATIEPAQAVALLHELPPGSTAWPRAWSVAETAAYAGVGPGVALPRADSRGSRIRPAPDGRDFVVNVGSTLYLVEPSLRLPPRRLADLGASAIADMVWIDGGVALAVVTIDHQLRRVARADGAVAPMAAGARVESVVEPRADRRLFVIADGHLREIELATGAPRSDLGVASAALRVDGAVVYATPTELMMKPDDAPAISIAPKSAVWLYGAHPAGRRIALFDGRAVRELERGRSGFTERGTWSITSDDVVTVDYHHDHLFVLDTDGISFLEPGHPPSRRALPTTRGQRMSFVVGGMVSTPDGLFIAGPGSISFLHPYAGPVQIAPYADPLRAFGRVGDYLVGLTPGAVVRSWDLRRLRPGELRIPLAARAVAIDAARAWLMHDDRLVAVDRATGAKRELGGPDDELAWACGTPGGGIITVNANRRMAERRPARFEAIDRRTLARTLIADTFTDLRCSPSGAVFAVASTDRVEVRSAGDPTRATFAFTPELRLTHLVVDDRWLAVVDEHGTATRIELATGRRATTTTGPIERLAVDAGGQVAFTRDRAISVWSGARVERVAGELDVAALVGNPAGFVAITADQAVVVIAPDRRVAIHAGGKRFAPVIARLAPFAAVSSVDDKLALLDLRDGSMVRLPWWVDHAAITDDAATVAGFVDGVALLFTATAPRDPARLRAWLGQATNATLVRGSATLAWPPATR